MNANQIKRTRIFIAAWCLVMATALISYGQSKAWMVRVAEIEIDSAYLEQYQAAIREHTEAALANEPGVLTLYAMYEKARPRMVRVLEIYASREAYEAHLKTPHFQKYKTGTAKMVKSLKLIDVDPIALGAKPGILNKR